MAPGVPSNFLHTAPAPPSLKFGGYLFPTLPKPHRFGFAQMLTEQGWNVECVSAYSQPVPAGPPHCSAARAWGLLDRDQHRLSGLQGPFQLPPLQVAGPPRQGFSYFSMLWSLFWCIGPGASYPLYTQSSYPWGLMCLSLSEGIVGMIGTSG